MQNSLYRVKEKNGCKGISVTATTQVVPELEVALLPQHPPSMRLRTNQLFRNAESNGKAGQIFQAEAIPIRGLEPISEG